MISLVFLVVTSVSAQTNPWSELKGPLRGTNDQMEIIGFYSNGCLRNAREIAVSNRYWEIVNTSRRRNFGHADMVNFLNYLGDWSVNENQFGKLILGDISQAAGGPMKFGHASHQIGLDVDIRFSFAPLDQKMADEKREGFVNPPVARHEVSKQLTQFNLHSTLVGKYWKPEYGLMLKKAAEYSRTERIFISPPIKKALCQAFKPKTPAERYPEWLRKVSPYHGHDSHLHVRLSCPKDAEACKAQGAVKSDPKDQTGVGCAGPTYNYWLDDSGKPGTLMAEEIEEFKKTNKLYSPAAEKEASAKALLDKLSKLPAACQALIGWNPQGKPGDSDTIK